MYGNLELSEQGFADPFDLCFAYKELDGGPTQVGVQKDAQEFLHFFFDSVENKLKPTSQKYLLQDVFGGTQVEQKTCMSCNTVKNSIQPSYTLSAQVEN